MGHVPPPGPRPAPHKPLYDEDHVDLSKGSPSLLMAKQIIEIMALFGSFAFVGGMPLLYSIGKVGLIQNVGAIADGINSAPSIKDITGIAKKKLFGEEPPDHPKPQPHRKKPKAQRRAERLEAQRLEAEAKQRERDQLQAEADEKYPLDADEEPPPPPPNV